MTTLGMDGVPSWVRVLGRKIANRRRRIVLWAIMVFVVGVALVAFAEAGRLPGASYGATVALSMFVAALVCEYVDSSLGMGYGTTLTPLLLLAGFDPMQIIPAVLLSEFVTGLLAAGCHHRDGNVNLIRDTAVRRTAMLLMALSAVGALGAVTLAVSVPTAVLKVLISVIVLSMGVVILATIRRKIRYRPANIVVLGALAAFNKGLSGGGYGPLVTAGQVVSGVKPKQAVAITSLAESMTCLIGLLGYIVAHLWVGRVQDWSLVLPLLLGASLSVPMATLTVRAVPSKLMRVCVGVATCLLGVLALGRLLVG